MPSLLPESSGRTSQSQTVNLLSSTFFLAANQRIRRTLCATAVVVALCSVGLAASFISPQVRKQAARTQFETGERMREALNGRPAEERTRRDYQKVADAYRKVYYVSPASSKADSSVVAGAGILAEMG